MKNVRAFYLKNFQFLEVKLSIYLNRRVFVMIEITDSDDEHNNNSNDYMYMLLIQIKLKSRSMLNNK